MPNLDISENIFAGRELTKAAMVDRAAEDKRSHFALDRLRETHGRQRAGFATLARLPTDCRSGTRTIAHGAE